MDGAGGYDGEQQPSKRVGGMRQVDEMDEDMNGVDDYGVSKNNSLSDLLKPKTLAFEGNFL